MPELALFSRGRRFVRALLVLAMVLLPQAALADGAQDAMSFVHGLAERAITTVADKSLADSERADRFRRLFVASFDMPEIGRFALARYWRSTSPEQQQQFLSLFEDIAVLTWAQRFKEYNGETLDALAAMPDGERGWVVDSRILRKQGPPIAVQWRLRRGEDERFRVVDIVVESVSMAITHRSDYGAALQSNGGKMDGLFATMRAKIEQLKAAG